MTRPHASRLTRQAFLSILALTCVLAARILGPSDLWDHTQPRTVSYTTDIVANGRWWLPISHGEFPATKPPLYNWLAVPAVRALGYASELAHKLPSVVALLASWLLLVRFGRSLGAGAPAGEGGGEALGWMAGLAFVSNHAIFKLAYLARPDMLLTLWMLIGWMAATTIFAAARRAGADARPRRRLLALVFWCAVGLAALTKGPVAVILVVYAVVGARLVGGSWRAMRVFEWAWGLPLALAIAGAWYIAVWRIDPVHLREQLWFNEVYGRVTGTGPEGTGGGPGAILRGLPVMPLYYGTRFLPWSLFSLLAMGAIWSRLRGGGGVDSGGGRGLDSGGVDSGGVDSGGVDSVGVDSGGVDSGGGGRSRLDAALAGAAVFVVLTVAVFSLSAGKRADYAAPALAPGALLAAWWLLASPAVARMRWLGPACATIMVVLLTARNAIDPDSPWPRFGDAITAFARDAGAAIRADPRPVFFHNTGRTHMQAMLGYSERERDAEALAAYVDRRERLWVVAGGYPDGPNAFASWAPAWYPSYRFTPVVRSAILPEEHGWLIQVTLFAAEPSVPGPSVPGPSVHEPPDSSPAPAGSDNP